MSAVPHSDRLAGRTERDAPSIPVDMRSKMAGGIARMPLFTFALAA
jgi:hypothetical protein